MSLLTQFLEPCASLSYRAASPCSSSVHIQLGGRFGGVRLSHRYGPKLLQLPLCTLAEMRNFVRVKLRQDISGESAKDLLTKREFIGRMPDDMGEVEFIFAATALN
jgi:hypothetical protein